MRALVTGGAGFVGSNLALELEKAGNDVVILDDFAAGNFKNLPGFKGDVVAADIAAPQEWLYKVGHVDAIFHQAAITDTTVTDQKKMMRVNVDGFRAILGFAVEAGVSKVVYASSAGVYGSGAIPMKESQEPAPANAYAFSKRAMERVAADFAQENPSVRVTGLRYFNVYGPGESFKGKAASMIWQLARQMKEGRRPRIFKFGEQFRDFIYVKDVVSANLKALDSGESGAFNVCTGKKTTFNDIIKILNTSLGTSFDPDYFDNPYTDFYQNETLGDPSLAEAKLGFKAGFSIEDGIADYIGKGKKEGKGRHAVSARNTP